MAVLPRSGRTVDVLNQPPPLAGHNVFLENRPPVETLEREDTGWATERVTAFGTSPRSDVRLSGSEPLSQRTRRRSPTEAS